MPNFVDEIIAGMKDKNNQRGEYDQSVSFRFFRAAFSFYRYRIGTLTNSGYTYSYNPNGLRLSKTDGNRTERYIYDGDSLCAMKVDDKNGSNTIFFHYDEANALVGFSVNGKDYFYDRDILGNINAVIDSAGTTLVSYAYGDFGAVTETIADSDEARLVAKVNPFKFKGYFFDNETGFYYLKSRYYSPELGRFISADGEIGQVGNTMVMNLFAYCRNNPINLSDEGGNWPSWATKLCIGLAVIAICAIAVVATGGFGASCIATSMLVGAVKGAVIGAVTGAVTGAIQGAITEGIKTGSWGGALKGALSGAIDGAADGFMFGAIGGAISGALNPSYCFIAGTMVMTAVGMKRIEEIKKGDTVLSYDDNVGRYEEMPVTDTYINETEELIEIKVGDEIIACTPGHSFLTTKGWKKASDLNDRDILKTLVNDKNITEVIKKKLTSKIKVYNFNVMSCHTYAIGNVGVIVHNSCINPAKRTATKEVSYKYRGKLQKAYNKNGKDIFYALDRSKHGGSTYKGFKLISHNKQLQWCGDYDANFNLIICKHKSPETIIFDVIKILPL